MADPFAISPYGVDFLKRQEGYKPRAYGDFKQNSIGWGTKAKYPGEIIDETEAQRRLDAETANVSDWLRSNVKVPLSQNQTDALISAGYNLGTGPTGLGRLLPDINAGNWDSVASRLPSFNHAGGQVNSGLVNRRAAEVALLTGKDPNAGSSMTPYAAGGFGAPANFDPEDPLSAMYAPPPQGGVGMMGGAPGGAPVPGGPVPINLPTPPNMRYSKLADALLGSAAGAQPTGWGSLLNALGDAGLGYSLANKADTQQKTYQSELAKALGGANDPAQLTAALISSGDPDLQQMGIKQKIAEAQLKAQAGKPLRGKERFLVTPNGVMDVETNQIVPGTAKPDNKQVKYNEGQTKAANFGNMMAKAEAELQKTTGVNPDGTPKAIVNPKNLLGATRDALVPFEGARNAMRPDETQAYEQAANQWIRAKLRKESGAAIGKDEMEKEFQTYFPQYWDGPETIARKTRAREEAQKGMIAESGGAYKDLFEKQQDPAAPTVGAPPVAPPKKTLTYNPATGELE